jgi:hypothetical protein
VQLVLVDADAATCQPAEHGEHLGPFPEPLQLLERVPVQEEVAGRKAPRPAASPA